MIFKFGLLQTSVLILALFLRFCMKEGGDIGSAILGTLIYSLFVIIFTSINAVLVVNGFNYLKGQFVWLTPFLFTIVLLCWFLFENGEIKIHYWKWTYLEFIVINLIFCLTNLVFIDFQRKKQGNDSIFN